MSDLPIFDEIAAQQKRGVLLVLTGPSGSGKDTVFAALKKDYPETIKITTTTSRIPREGEQDGAPYYFVSREHFEQLVAEGAFFEWVEFRGELYGTQKNTLTDALATDRDVLWRIEAKGVKNIKKKIKEMVPRSVFVFLTAVSLDILRDRVRKAEGEERARERFKEPLVIWEMKQYRDCEYLVVNTDSHLEEAVQKIRSIMEAKRAEILD